MLLMQSANAAEFRVNKIEVPLPRNPLPILSYQLSLGMSYNSHLQDWRVKESRLIQESFRRRHVLGCRSL